MQGSPSFLWRVTCVKPRTKVQADLEDRLTVAYLKTRTPEAIQKLLDLIREARA